jgi:hypothetical protein
MRGIIYQPRMADLRWRYYRGEADDRGAARMLAAESDRMLDCFRVAIAASREEALLTHHVVVRSGDDGDGLGLWHELALERREQ